MIVAVAILLVLTGFGIAGLVRFNDRQKVASSAKQLQHIFRTAQSKARVKDIPQGCDILFSYEVKRAGDNIVSSANCQNGNSQVSSWAIPTDEITLNPGNFSANFKTLHGSADLSTGKTLSIKVSGSGIDYTFEVTSGGEITTGGFN